MTKKELSFGYGELPPHPIEAKRLSEVPEGWSPVETIGERELYEPTDSGKTKAEQYDGRFGASNWGIRPFEMSDGSPTQLITVYARTAEQREEDSSAVFQIPEAVMGERATDGVVSVEGTDDAEN